MAGPRTTPESGSGETVSAVVIVRNGEERLGRALDSIISQTRPVDEIVVVVGRSNDRTLQVAESFAEVTIVDQADQVGIASARNLGVAAATGDRVAFLDHDDIWRTAKIEQQLRAVRGTDRNICTGLMRMFINDPAEVQPSLARQIERPVRPGLTPSALLIKRSLFTEVGCFDTSLKIGCDADWIARSQPPTWGSVDEIVVDKEIHGSNISGNAELNGREMLRVARAHLGRQQESS